MVSSNVVQGGKFRVGDKVSHITEGSGAVVFGPYLRRGSERPMYLVEGSDGRHFTGSEKFLSGVPRFKVGQVVRTRVAEDLCKVAAGPFRRDGNPLYVLEDPTGNHRVGYEDTMVPVVE